MTTLKNAIVTFFKKKQLQFLGTILVLLKTNNKCEQNLTYFLHFLTHFLHILAILQGT